MIYIRAECENLPWSLMVALGYFLMSTGRNPRPSGNVSLYY